MSQHTEKRFVNWILGLVIDSIESIVLKTPSFEGLTWNVVSPLSSLLPRFGESDVDDVVLSHSRHGSAASFAPRLCLGSTTQETLSSF